MSLLVTWTPLDLPKCPQTTYSTRQILSIPPLCWCSMILYTVSPPTNPLSSNPLETPRPAAMRVLLFLGGFLAVSVCWAHRSGCRLIGLGWLRNGEPPISIHRDTPHQSSATSPPGFYDLFMRVRVSFGLHFVSSWRILAGFRLSPFDLSSPARFHSATYYNRRCANTLQALTYLTYRSLLIGESL